MDEMRCSMCNRPAGMGHSIGCDHGYEGDMRKLLLEWTAYALTMAEAGLVELPARLMAKTTGVLDATAV